MSGATVTSGARGMMSLAEPSRSSKNLMVPAEEEVFEASLINDVQRFPGCQSASFGREVRRCAPRRGAKRAAEAAPVGISGSIKAISSSESPALSLAARASTPADAGSTRPTDRRTRVPSGSRIPHFLRHFVAAGNPLICTRQRIRSQHPLIRNGRIAVSPFHRLAGLCSRRAMVIIRR